MTVEFYDLPTRTLVAVTLGGKSHLLDRHGRTLCGAIAKGQKRRSMSLQTTLDIRPTCGWCILLLNEPDP
jgi:hypothetical protein